MQNIMPWVMLAAAGLSAGLIGCVSASKAAGSIEKSAFGKAPDGAPVEIYALRNSKGMEARIATYGGILVSLKTADRNGNFGDVVLGYDDLDTYIKHSPFFGALVGRYGNRIDNAKFTLNGREYSLAHNNGANHLHGGIKGFDKVVWKATPRMTAEGPVLQLDYLSKDGEEGYPGNLTVTATYTLTEDNALRLDFTATTDQDTICNLTTHSYFNLRGSGDILSHEVQMNADNFIPVNQALIPTGEIRPVAGTPFDLRQPVALGSRIDQPDDQLKIGDGFDHCFVINGAPGHLRLATRVYDPSSGRVMELLTTEPGVQFYTANGLGGSPPGKGGVSYGRHHAFCLEPQHFPDSPNHANFPSTVLKAGKTYHETSVFRFSTR